MCCQPADVEVHCCAARGWSITLRPGVGQRQLRRLPGGNAARDLAHVGKAFALEQTRRDGRAVTARTIDDQRPIFREIPKPRGESPFCTTGVFSASAMAFHPVENFIVGSSYSKDR